MAGFRLYPLPFSSGSAESPTLVLLVERALGQQEETKGAELDILARGGTIVLMGRVGEERVKIVAERVTRSVRGVVEVDNRIEVEG